MPKETTQRAKVLRPGAPLDPPLETVELPSGPLSHSDTGEGPAVVGIHGLPASSRDFRWLDAAFDGRVRFLRLDLPGFGDSTRDPDRVRTLDDLAVAVCEFCEAKSLRDVVLVGHSMGGAIAVEAAGRSDRVCAAALVNSSGPIVHRSIFPRTYRALIRIVDLHPLIRRLALALGKPLARRLGFSKHLSDEALIWAIRLCAGYAPARFAEHLTSLDKPVLVAWAEDDPAVQRAVVEALLACAPDAERLPFVAGGHNLQSTRATPLADAIVDWIASTT